MGSKGDFLENEILDDVLRGNAFTPATSLWVALYTALPTDAGGGTEVSGTGYARVEFSSSSNSWALAASGATENVATVTFPSSGAGGWGTIVGFALWNDSVSGNLYYWGSLTSSKAVLSGDTAKFSSGTLDIAED